MRAFLVVNPKATTTTVRSRDVLVRALRSQVELNVVYTEQRGHAAELARQATVDGADLIVTLGGDGTVNEAINGILTVDSGPAAERAAERPALAVVPGGSTNVFARALGLPRDWTEGMGAILEALREGRTRTVGLGRADERYFTFCAGLGIDAEVIARVEQARRRGRVSSPALYFRSALAQYALTDARRPPSIVLERRGAPTETGLSTVIIQNTAPWTYLGDRPIQCCPDATFELGLDLLALRALHVASTTITATRMLGRRPNPHGKQVLHLHDLDGFTLRSTSPMAFQVDGDYLGERNKLDFAAIPNALRIVC
ncbi:MAG: diacylglycerol kinase family lipid kinase [Dactylosporangium sp.]|nr:diacylglycerol kinase family lipid kinase [Dactylosporangium sp.]NNJ62735.1 diacylglycerol kinase family lipid kinase [Dactylosporangium sp.]